MTETEVRNIWVQRTQEFRQRVKESGLTPEEYCEQLRKKAVKKSLWQRFIRWLVINV